MLLMCGNIRREYQYVIKVNNHKTIQRFPKYRIHEALKRGRGITKPERHDHKFEETPTRSKGCFKLVARRDLNLVIPGLQINRRIHTRSCQRVKDCIDTRYRISV